MPNTWLELISRPEREIALDEGALLIAAAADSTVDVVSEINNLDHLAALADSNDVASVCRSVFDTLGFQGDLRTYDDPQNSYLHRVIARRIGIPITLSVLVIEIARRRGVQLEGVGMPGHFLVRDPSAPDLLIDPFSGGQRLDPDGCARLMRSVIGSQIEFEPAMLQPIGPRAILARMLANLDLSFRRRQEFDGLLWVTRLRVAIPGTPLRDRLTMADTLAGLGSYDEAAAVLDDLAADSSTPAETADSLRAQARRLMSRLN